MVSVLCVYSPLAALHAAGYNIALTVPLSFHADRYTNVIIALATNAG